MTLQKILTSILTSTQVGKHDLSAWCCSHLHWTEVNGWIIYHWNHLIDLFIATRAGWERFKCLFMFRLCYHVFCLVNDVSTVVSRSYLALEKVMKWIKNVCSQCVLYPGDVVFTENRLILGYFNRMCLGLSTLQKSVDFQKQPQKKHVVVVVVVDDWWTRTHVEWLLC